MKRHHRHRHHTRTAVAVLAATAAVMTGGCSSNTTPETTAADTAAETTRDPVLIAAAPGELDPGPYTTVPHDTLPKTAGDDILGQFVESQRMAEFLVLPVEIDPELTGPQSAATRTLFDSSALEFLIDDGNNAVRAIGDDHGFYAGYSTARYDPADHAGITHAVLEFPDTATATAAATELHQVQFLPDLSGFSEMTPPQIPVAYPQETMPDSLVSAEFISSTYSDEVWIESFTPHGRYIIYTRANGPADREGWARRSIARALELQRPMIDEFPFTEPADLPELEVDVDGVMRLAVPPPSDDENMPVPAVYGPRGAAHQEDQLDTLDLFADTGTTNLGIHGTFVYSTTGEDQAATLFDRFIGNIRAQTEGITYVPAAGPPGVPDARCFDVVTTSGSFGTCLVLYDTYVGEVRTSTLEASHELATAQYMIFEANASQG